ncbi:MAG: hypothetical protein J0H06_10895, partial [Actinobacteria bacterium]|nr:hypothetical protein [Actinomycetota bacterium]
MTGLPIPSRSGVVRIVFNPSGGDEEDEDDETINNPSLINPQPVIRGTPAVGQTLTCDPGASSGAQYTTAFQWLRDGGLIDGATGATYVVAAADAGHQLQCRVGITDAAGTAVASSAPVAVPAPAPGGPAVRRAGGSSAIPKATVSKAAAKDAGVSVVLGCGSGGAGACK